MLINKPLVCGVIVTLVVSVLHCSPRSNTSHVFLHYRRTKRDHLVAVARGPHAHGDGSWPVCVYTCLVLVSAVSLYFACVHTCLHYWTQFRHEGEQILFKVQVYRVLVFYIFQLYVGRLCGGLQICSFYRLSFKFSKRI